MLQRIDLRGVTGPVTDHLPRPDAPGDRPLDVVREIISAVRRDGDAALRACTVRFDQVELEGLTVDAEEIHRAARRVSAPVREALQAAAANIRRYHESQMPADVTVGLDGLAIRAWHRPVRRVGCYVPGGRAVYPSTVLMTAVPACVAGVAEVALVVPPDPGGRVPDVILAAAATAGVTEVHPVGGAQAIAALAYGTESISPVDVIVGPGNTYVALAKQEVAGVVGVPSAFTGPSEVVVVADGSSAPELAAIDLILQAEHGPDGLAWLVTWRTDVADRVTEAVTRLTAAASRRSQIEATLCSSGHAVVCDSVEQAMAVVNAIAPEHLELHTADPEAQLDLVHNAGAVFCGPWAPASLGDYIAGPSHVLPTSGSARFAGALTVGDFLKDIHIITADRRGFEAVADHVVTLAEAEGLDAHAESIRIRRRQAGVDP
ncbi:MAG: histidinol dehydrogenase [Acidimicrobiales bacterium]